MLLHPIKVAFLPDANISGCAQQIDEVTHTKRILKLANSESVQSAGYFISPSVSHYLTSWKQIIG